MNEDCPKCGYPTKQNMKGLYQPGQPCPNCSYNAQGVEPDVSDLGRHRKLRGDVAKEILDVFIVIGSSGQPRDTLIRMLADHTVALLQLPKRTLESWYES